MLIRFYNYFIKFCGVNNQKFLWSVGHIYEADKYDFLLLIRASFKDLGGTCEYFLTDDFKGEVNSCGFLVVVDLRNCDAVDSVVAVVTHCEINSGFFKNISYNFTPFI